MIEGIFLRASLSYIEGFYRRFRAHSLELPLVIYGGSKDD